MSASKNEKNHADEDLIRNYSDDELIFKELCSKCSFLESQTVELLSTKQNFVVLNEKCENVSRRLLRIKSDCEYYKSHLCKALHNLRVTTEKQKIISKKKLDEFLRKRKKSEEYHKVSPIKCKLEELVNGNRELEKEYEAKSYLLNLTKRQNDELVSTVMQTFKKKVCEFSELVLRFKGSQ